MDWVKRVFSTESLTAVIAWAVVSISALWLMSLSEQFSLIDIVIGGCFLSVFIVGFLLAIAEYEYRSDVNVRLALMLLQYLAILGATFFVPFTYIAILMTIWSAQIPYFVSFKFAVASSPIWSAPLWLIFAVYWQKDGVLLTSLLFWTFNLFSLVMVNATIKERRATEQANQVNRELLAAQTLLREASKQAERVRIARNIHDLLGHHLTALTINLQVASRISEGDAQRKISQCHDLAKLLLSDVREAVSEIREKSAIELEHALRALLDNVPHLDVSLYVESDINISDVNVAETILRCVQESITNTLKHSNAKTFSIVIGRQGPMLTLTMKDNGSHAKQKDFVDGNGLKGISERIDALGGRVSAMLAADGFITEIELPEVV